MGAIFADDSSASSQKIFNRSYELSRDRFHETRGMGTTLNLVMVLQWYFWSTIFTGPLSGVLDGAAKLEDCLELNGFERDV
ncbi:unnamed protein product [Clonostachys rhizophaga]|uniref:Uncharacterized protein n=1 Tax=Clonostachys rhizophaga TaxID=160324 RepID=A0A9N9YRZ7_9HYPO|nr:unnamed protein product [Clonostachys rhizophaga]